MGNVEWVLLLGTLEMVEKDSGNGASLSLWKLCERKLEGRLHCWGLWRISRKGSGDEQLFP